MMNRQHGVYDPKDDVKCSDCSAQAVWQDLYDDDLCEDHLREAMEADAADIEVKRRKEDW